MSFRLKLIVATMLVVVGVTSAALIATQQNVGRTYTQIFHERFEDQVGLLRAQQEARLASVKLRLLEFTRSPRLLAVLEAEARTDADPGEPRGAAEPDTARVYQTVKDALLDFITTDPAAVFRVVDRNGEVLRPKPNALGAPVAGEGGTWETEVASVARGLTAAEPQRIGYLALDVGSEAPAANPGSFRGGDEPPSARSIDPAREPSAPRSGGLYEFVITRIIDRFTRRDYGALAIGFPVELGDPMTSGVAEAWRGIWHGGRVYSRSIPEDARRMLADAVSSATSVSSGDGSFGLDVDGAPTLVFHHALDPEAGFPPSYQVVLYSMAELRRQQHALGWRVLAFGALGLLLGLGLSLILAHRLSVPIRELADATEKIGAGDLDAKVPVRSADETGRLAAAFNEMVDGLALKERYRSVLDLVADKSVAQRLVDGQLALGGELREVTVLFCDIRGFTALTEEMTPVETIALLNEHMTALTRVVHAHGGVVDKFMGDGLMALFGAPQASGDHAAQAVAAASAMVEARLRLNARSPHHAAIGIGLATGSVVAGCVGAADRLNYTVVGGHVNLAARLCNHAAGMQVLIDEATRRLLPPTIDVEPVAPLVLKGFSAPVAAYKVTTAMALATAS